MSELLHHRACNCFWCHLHAHSTMSTLDGYGTQAQIADRIVELGHDVCAVTDHGNIFSYVDWSKQAKAKGFKPIFGCEFYIVEDMLDRTRAQQSLGVNAFPHITVLARTQKGFENIIALSEKSFSDGFYYKPRIDFERLWQHQEGLTIMSGCVAGWMSRFIELGRDDMALEWARNFKNNIEDFYIELIPEPDFLPSVTSTIKLIKIARELNIPLITTADAHFPRKEDWQIQDLMLCINMGKQVGEPKAVQLPDYQYYCSAEELYERCDHMAAAYLEGKYHEFILEGLVEGMENAHVIADRCEAEQPQGRSMVWLGLKESGYKDSNEALIELATTGLARRDNEGYLDYDDSPFMPGNKTDERLKAYYDRLHEELAVISRKGFADYMLCVRDICLRDKNAGGLTMCRGSAGGSLLLFCLYASETDSLRHGLSFQRFYDDTRPDPPDVDMDFETQRRDNVIDGIYEVYGESNCAKISAYVLMRPKAAVIDTAKAFGLKADVYSPLASKLDSKDDDFDGQLEDTTDPAVIETIEQHPELRIAARLMGQCRQTSINAAGVLISQEPLNRVIATYRQPGKSPVASVDKHQAAALGLLKLDILAVLAFDVLADAARMVGIPLTDLYKLPLNNQELYEYILSGKVCGIFQLDGAALGVARTIKAQTFEDLYASSALCRPGAMDFVPLYQKNKFDRSSFDEYMNKLHPEARTIIAGTYGVILYQEQMMAFARMAGFDWPTVHKLRKRVAAASFNGHALGAEFGDPFINGCMAKGISEEEALYYWSAIKQHGVYSFNKSHCVTYALVTYWTAWMKMNHRDAYYAAFLKHEDSDMLIKRLVNQYREEGGKVQAISPAHSREGFSLSEPGVIVGGWSSIEGIGPKTARKIIDKGPYTNWQEMIAKGALSERILTDLLEAGATGHKPLSTAKMAKLIPWFPIKSLDKEHEKYRQQYGLITLDQCQQQTDNPWEYVETCGYIVSKYTKPRTGSFTGEKVIYLIEDETACITMRVSSRDTKLNVQLKALANKGSFLLIGGNMSPDRQTLFVKQAIDIATKTTIRSER